MTTAFQNLIARVKALDPNTAQQTDKHWVLTDHLDGLLEDALNPTRHDSWADGLLGEEEEEEALSEDEAKQVSQIKLLWLVRKGTNMATLFHHPSAAWQALSLPGKASELDIPMILHSPLLGPILACAPECFAKLLVGRSTTIANSLGIDPEAVKNYLEAHGLEIIHAAIWLWKQEDFIEELGKTAPTMDNIGRFFMDIPADELMPRIPIDNRLANLLSSYLASSSCKETLVNSAVEAAKKEPNFLGHLLTAVITPENEKSLSEKIIKKDNIQRALQALVKTSAHLGFTVNDDDELEITLPDKILTINLQSTMSGYEKNLRAALLTTQASPTLLGEALMRATTQDPDYINTLIEKDDIPYRLRQLIANMLTKPDIAPLRKNLSDRLTLLEYNTTQRGVPAVLDYLLSENHLAVPALEYIQQILRVTQDATILQADQARQKAEIQRDSIRQILNQPAAVVSTTQLALKIFHPLLPKNSTHLLNLGVKIIQQDLNNNAYKEALTDVIIAIKQPKKWTAIQKLIAVIGKTTNSQGLHQLATRFLADRYLSSIIAPSVDDLSLDNMDLASDEAQGLLQLISKTLETEGMNQAIQGLFQEGEPSPRAIIKLIFDTLRQDLTLVETIRKHATISIKLLLELPLIPQIIMQQLGGKENLEALIYGCLIDIIPENGLDQGKITETLNNTEDLLLHIITKDQVISHATEALHQLNHINLADLTAGHIEDAIRPIITDANLYTWNDGVLASLLKEPSTIRLKKTIRILQNNHVATLVQKALVLAHKNELKPESADHISQLIAAIVSAHDGKNARLRDDVIDIKYTRNRVGPSASDRIQEDAEITRLRNILRHILKSQRQISTTDLNQVHETVIQPLLSNSNLVEKKRLTASCPEDGVWTQETLQTFLQNMKAAYYQDFDKPRANAEAEYATIIRPHFSSETSAPSQTLENIKALNKQVSTEIAALLNQNSILDSRATMQRLAATYDNRMMDHRHLQAVCQTILVHSLPMIGEKPFYESTQQFAKQLVLQNYFGMIAPLTSMIQQNLKLRETLGSKDGIKPILQLLLPFIVSSHTMRVGYLETLQEKLQPILNNIVNRCNDKKYTTSLQNIFTIEQPWSTKHAEALLAHLEKHHELKRAPSMNPNHELGHHALTFLQQDESWRKHFTDNPVATYNLIEFFCKDLEEPNKQLYHQAGQEIIPSFLRTLGGEATTIAQYTSKTLIKRILTASYTQACVTINGLRENHPALLNPELQRLLNKALPTRENTNLMKEALINGEPTIFLDELLKGPNVETDIYALLPETLRIIFPERSIRPIIGKLRANFDSQTLYETILALLDTNPATALEAEHLAYLKKLITPEDMLDMLHHHSGWSQYFITKVDIVYVYKRLHTHNLSNISESVFWSILLRKTMPIIMGLLLAASITSTLYYLTGLSAMALSAYGIFTALCCVPICMIGESLYQAQVESYSSTPIIAFMAIIIATIIMATFSSTIGISALPFIGICFLASYAIINIREQQKYLQAIEPVIHPEPGHSFHSQKPDQAESPTLNGTPPPPNGLGPLRFP